MTKTIRLHASGAVETFQFTDDPTYYPPATIIGTAPQWDDGSDATYARSQTDAGPLDYRSPTVRLDSLPSAVTLAQVITITVHLRFDTAHPSGETSRAYRFDLYDDTQRSSTDTPIYGASSAFVDFPDPPDDDLIHEVDYTIYPSGGTYIDTAAVLAALQGGAWLSPSTVVRTPWQRSALTVYEAWVDVVLVGDSMVRQWPNDQGGLTTTPRLYPPPRNQRIHGGHH